MPSPKRNKISQVILKQAKKMTQSIKEQHKSEFQKFRCEEFDSTQERIKDERKTFQRKE